MSNSGDSIRYDALEMSDELLGDNSITDRLKDEKNNTIFSHLYEVFTLSTPLIGGLYLTMGVEVISLYFLGNLGDVKVLAAAGLAMMMMNVVVMSILFGSIRGMETLVSQAYGKKDHILMSAYMNRGRMILVVMFIPLAIILWFSEPILLLLGQNPEVAALAATYA